MQLTTPHLTANTFPSMPAQSFDAIYQPTIGTTLGKRSLQLDVHDLPQSKRHHEDPDFTLFESFPTTTGSATGPSNWAVDMQPTPPFTAEVGLSDEAADVCATWFNKYNVLPR
jgi:hypothetical protein